MAVTKRREAERAVVRAALDARDAVFAATDEWRIHDEVYEQHYFGEYEHEAFGALLSAVDTLRNLPKRSIDSPDPAARDDATDTSRLAARLVAPKHGSIRRTVYDAVHQRFDGMTDLELEELIGRPHQTISSARNSLVESGWLMDSGRRRSFRGSRRSIVWIVSRTL